MKKKEDEAESKVSILTLLGVLQAERAADFYLSTCSLEQVNSSACKYWNGIPVSKFYIILVLSDLLV